MVIYNALIFIFLTVMILYALYILVKLIILKKDAKLNYLKSFKKGKVVIIYIIALPLLWLGYFYDVSSRSVSFLLALQGTLELVVLKVDYSGISLLMHDNHFYFIAIYVLVALVILNVFVFSFALFGKNFLNTIRKIYYSKFSKKIYCLVGFNDENKQIIKSIDRYKYKVIFFVEDNQKISDFAFVNKFCFIKFNERTNFEKLFLKLFGNFNNKVVNLIINTKNDTYNLMLIDQISNLISNNELTSYSIDNDRGLKCYVFGEPQNISNFTHYVKKSKGCIQYLNKYELIARDFINKYPLTKYLDENDINYDEATLKNDLDLNVILVGFGKTSQKIFLTSVANNQFIVKDQNNCVKEKQVHYVIYDKTDSKNNKNLNHNYYRFLKEIDTTKKNYLPLPPKISFEDYYKIDINDENFYKSLFDNIQSKPSRRNFNYIIISFGTDLENLDLGEKICSKLKEWGLFNTCKVFVKIRNGAFSRNVVNKEFISSSGFLIFGNEDEVVYNVNKIVAETLEVMAKNRHLAYKITENMSLENFKEVCKEANDSWYEQNQIQRESNVYAILSIRSKLNLVGFDYDLKSSNKLDVSEEFMTKYQKNDPIIYDDSLHEIKGKRTIIYSNNRVKNSLRENLAKLEHQRWNAYMISKGCVPSTIEQIKNNDSKRLDLRRHGNITTFEGLEQFREILSKVLNKSSEETDVIRYDYQIMDDVVWLLDNNGFKIIKK